MQLVAYMEHLRELQNIIAKVPFSRDEPDSAVKYHKEVYSYIVKHVLAPNSPLVKNNVPPLEVIIYSIKNILYPTFNIEQIPDFLDLLATAEFYRERTIFHTKSALVWNDYYQKDRNHDAVITLTPGEKDLLQGLKSTDKALRQIYITIVCQSCQSDLYNLWRKQEDLSTFMLRFNEYFPDLNEHCSKESPRLFHCKLSEEETQQLGQTGQDFCKFIQDSYKWAECKNRKQSVQSLFHTEEFRLEFPEPCDYTNLSGLIEYYLGKVEMAARKVQDTFPNDL